MARINVVYWNVQDFGQISVPFREAAGPRCTFMSAVALGSQADVLFVMELKRGAIFNGHLDTLHRALQALPPPRNNWYFDWVKGSLSWYGHAPFATAGDLDWDAGHHEGYAVFWNLNIAKFGVTPPPPLGPPNALVPNQQSDTVRGGPPLPAGHVPPGGITVGAEPAYVIPTGSAMPGHPASTAPVLVNSGTVLPQNTIIGPAGIWLNGVNFGGQPVVVVPGNHLVEDAFTLPAPGTVVVHERAVSLVVDGRRNDRPDQDGDTSYFTHPFTPGVPHDWRTLTFTQGSKRAPEVQGSRRPAFITLDVPSGGAGAAQRLIPVIAYHSPASRVSAAGGMQRASFSRPMYQAWDAGAPTPGWIDNDRAVLGGDFNLELSTRHYAYRSFTDPFARGGANCQPRVNTVPPPSPELNPVNRTMTKLRSRRPPRIPFVARNTDNFRTLAIDNAFHRGFPGAAAPVPAPAPVYDLMRAVAAQAGAFDIPDRFVEPFADIPALTAYWDQAWGLPSTHPLLPLQKVMNVRNFVIDLAAGAFTERVRDEQPKQGETEQERQEREERKRQREEDEENDPAWNPAARRAAEFVHLCVSDHLPVLFTMSL